MAEKQASTEIVPSDGTAQLGAVELATDGPTELPFSALETWVIWQFPRPRKGWLCGAVHPPVEGYGWLPASVHPNKEKLLVHGHAPVPFADPESAADWLAAHG